MLSTAQLEEFTDVVKPVQQWLLSNCCPHDIVLVDFDSARVLEGVAGTPTQSIKLSIK